MWIFSTVAFFSVVENKDDQNQVIIRSRLKKDIDGLKRIFDSLKLKTTKILLSYTSDYRYRFSVDRMDWVTVMIRLMIDVHYSNFKDAVLNGESGLMRERRHNAYLKIWEIMRELQIFDNNPTEYQTIHTSVEKHVSRRK